MLMLAGESGWMPFLRYVVGYKLYERAEFWGWVIILGPPLLIAFLADKIAKNDNVDANGFLLLLSSFLPIVGIICYFARHDVDHKAAGIYLGCGIVSFVVGLILQFIFT